jgi:hypothetical protein
MSQDVIKGEVLPDGRIKSVTDPISGENHQAAEAFFKMLASLSGGEEHRQSRGGAEQHHHHHHDAGVTHTHDGSTHSH